MAEVPGKPINLGGVAEGLPKYTPPPTPSFSNREGERKAFTFDEMIDNVPTSVKGADFIPASSIYIGERFNASLPFTNTEEMAAQQQSATDKWFNGIGKMVGTASTSFLSGTLGTAVGIGNYVASGFKASAFYDNPVNRMLDDVNKKMEDILPNYYTEAEKDANWFSSENMLTANFWSDKVIKNLGYSIGALGAGVGWSSLFKVIGLTNKLVAAGKGLETVTAVDTAIKGATATGRFGAMSKALTSLSAKYIKPALQTITPGERALTSIMGTMGEASFEALHGMNDYRNKLIDSYINEYGVKPTGADLDEINRYAESVGNFTWGMNVALLTATNYIQLPKMINSSRSAERRMINNITKTKLDDAATIAQKVEGKFEPELYKGKLLSAIPIPYEKIAGRPGKFFGKYIARPIGLLFSPAEAFEEGMQSAISIGTTNYFDRAYENKEDTSSFFQNVGGVFKNVFTKGVNEVLSTKEGLESILIGGIAGGLQTSFSPFGMSEVKERGLFGEGGVRGKNTQKAIDELNKSKTLNQALKDAVKYINIGINSQHLRREAISENDILSEKDYEKDYALSYILPRVKYGKKDSIIEELKLYKQVASTTEGFEALKADEIVLKNESQEKFLQRLNNLEKVANEVDTMHTLYDDKYSLIVDKDGKRIFDDSVIEKMTYATAKIRDYDDRLASLETTLLGKDLSTLDFKEALVKTEQWKKGDIKGALATPEVEEALKAVGAYIDGKEINDEKTTLKADFTDFAEMMLRRKTFIDEFNDIIKSPEKYQEQPVTPTAKPQIDKETGKPKTVSITTRSGKKDIELGVEYFTGRTAEESEKDAEGFPILKFPKFTIIEDLPDGTVMVRAQDGKVHKINKTAFAKYKFSKVSDVMNNRKAMFFIESAGQLFKFKRKGGKKPLTGILVWSDTDRVLKFQYKDSRGITREFNVTGDQFIAKEGFTEGVITKEGALTPAQAQLIEEFKKNPEPVAVRSIVSEVINNIYTSSKTKLDEINKTLKDKNEKLKEIEESLQNLTETEKGVPKKSITKAARKTLNELSQLRNAVEKDIDNLEYEKEILEDTIPYFESLLSNIGDIGDEKLFIEELKDEVDNLEKLIDNTNESLSSANKLLKDVDDALKQALSLIQDYAKRLREENPNLPASLEALQEQVERFLGEEGAKQFIEQKLGFTQTLTDVEDQIEDFSEELGIPNMTVKVEKLREEIKKLQTNLNEYIKEQSIKAELLSELEASSKKYEEEKKEEALMVNNIAIWNEMLGSADKSIQTRAYSSEYEGDSKKDNIAIVTSTKATQSDKPHHVRANIVGANLHTFTNRNRIKGVIVTSKNEGELGLPGLTQFLIDESDATPEEKAGIDPKKTIALVLVEEGADGVNRIIGVDGKPLASPSLNDAIFQVFPDPSLTWSAKFAKSGEDNSMFRKDTPKDTKEHYRKQYEQWVNDTLENPSLKSYSIDASFGIPEYVKYLNDEGKEVRDYNAIVPVTDANLITSSDLNLGPVIYVPTVEATVRKGSTAFDSPLGRPFLSTYNGYVKLKNAIFTRKKAEVIYEAIYQLSKEIKRDGNAQSDKSKRLTNWLKSVVYWGPPRNSTGRNNIFFERTDEGLMLFVSGKGEKFKFTPSSLENNKERIITGISGMYHNIRYDLVSPDSTKNLWKDPYEEIIGFDKEGSPIVREVDGNPFWPNYQTYLLSAKGRPLEELPLFTQMTPVKDKTKESNREGIYFTLTNLQASYTAPPKKAAVTPLTPAAPATSSTPAPVITNTEGAFNTAGDVTNSVAIGEFGNAQFTFNIKEFIKSGETGATGLNLIGSSKEVAEKIAKARSISVEDAENILGASVMAKLKPQIEQYKKEQSPPAPLPVILNFNLTGEVENTVPLGAFGNVNFKFNEKVFVESKETDGLEIAFSKKMIDAIIENYKQKGNSIDEAQAMAIITASIIAKVRPQLSSSPVAAPIAPQAPVSDIEALVITEENYNNWSNVRDKSDYQAFVDQVKFTLSMFDQVPDKSKITAEVVYEMLDNVKAFANKAVKDKVVPLIVAKYKTSVSDKKADIESKKQQLGLDKVIQVYEPSREDPHYHVTVKGDVQEFLAYVERGEWRVLAKEPSTGKYLHDIRMSYEKSREVAEKYLPKALRDLMEESDKQDTADKQKAFEKGPIAEYVGLYRKEYLNERIPYEESLLEYYKSPTYPNKDSQENIIKLQTERLDTLKAELAALESTPSITPSITPSEAPVGDDFVNTPTEEELMMKQLGEVDENPDVQRVILKSAKKFDTENWKSIEQWLKKNFPNVPVYRVKNVIRGTNGETAWGMFKDGAIYVYENAEVGTIYHEVFEGVWKMFTDNAEKLAIFDEFRNRKGTFIDRPSGRTVKYSEATNDEIREQLAEEFRDYVLYKKIPAKPTVGKPWIVKLFSDLVNFIKTFFTGEKAQVNTANLFEKIGTGYYTQHSPYQSSLAFAKKGIIDIEEAFADRSSVLRIKNIPADQVHDIMQHMTYMTVYKLITTKQGLFSLPKVSKSLLYEELKEDIQKTALLGWKNAQKLLDNKEILQEEFEKRKLESQVLWKKVTNEWNDLKKKHEEYLKPYNIEFDEEDNIQINSDERTKESGWQDATKIDGYRKANSAIKLLLSSLPIMNSDGKPVLSSVFGYKLVPTSQAFMAVMNNVYTSRDTEEMLKRVHDMALSDVNYRLLYTRLTGSFDPDNLSDIETLENVYDGQLLAAFWRTFKKQNPDVKNVIIFENGDVEVGDSNLSTAARQVRNEYVNTLTKIVKEGSVYMKYDSKKNAYVGNPTAVKEVKLNSVDAQIAFLKDLGIEFKYSEVVTLNKDSRASFDAAVAGIKRSIETSQGIVTPTARSLEITNRLMSLSLIRASIDNPEFDSTFFNVKGERTQTFIGTNAASDLYDFLSQAETLDDLIGTPYEYLLTDSFAKDYVDDKTGMPVATSVILRNMFDYESRRKKTNANSYMRVGYADGTIDMAKGKNKQTSNLTYKQRLIQELNLNLSGYYYNLVPGDASLQAMVYMGNEISPTSLLSGYGSIHSIFKGYVISEIELAREDRTIKKKGDRNSKDLRFLKSILGDVHDKMLKDKDFLDKNVSAQTVYNNYASQINSSVEAFIQKEMLSLEQSLYEYGISATNSEGNVAVEGIKFPENDNMDKGDFKRYLTSLTVNFMINNIELHKLLYSDPYQYSDELKRIKNFLSPRQSIASSPKLNKLFNKIWNKGYKKGDFEYTDFLRNYLKTATLEDVKATLALKDYDLYDETDGGGIMIFKAHRNFRIRAGEWNDDEERQFKHDMAFEKLAKSKASVEELLKFDRKNPRVASAYTPLKPIVSGGKLNNNTYNDVMLDKFALYPLSYRIMWNIAHAGGKKEINAMKLYDKMQRDDIDYVVFESGRKVGAETLTPVYNEDGSFNDVPFEGIVDVPFHIMSIQSEVPSKDTPLVTRGSQITKLIKLDFMKAGVPLDYLPEEKSFENRYKRWNSLSEEDRLEKSQVYKEIKNNTNLLNLLTDYGYKMLLKKLGIQEVIEDGKEATYVITNRKKVADTLREEIMKREINDNISDALEALENGTTIIEATPAYQQIRNILYSIADKNVISQKITGGMKVQIASTFLEENKMRQVEGTKAYESDVLDFYSITKDGKTVNVCEIMVGRWFNTTMSDQELLEYLNDENNPEGQKILRGVAYRIPTQKQNSIDVFKIKQFLPKEFGDSVVIPSALVRKVGSDFDIDKLTIYFKNIFKDVSGKLKLVERKGNETATKEHYGKIFDEILQKKQISKSELLDAIDILINKRPDVENLVEKYEFLIDIVLEDVVDDADTEEAMIKLEREIAKLNDVDLQKKLREDYVDKMYKSVLENEYVESMENLVTNPLNYERLLTPNSADQMKELSEKITKKLGFEAFDYSSTGNLLSRRFMSRLRHAFVTGKYAIGIAAVNQTNHALNQSSTIFVDYTKLDNVPEQDRAFLGDGKVKFAFYNKIGIKGNAYPTLSFIKDALSELTDEKLAKTSNFISDIIGQFIDGYVDISKGPWIMELGATPNVASTWLFLIKIGVPIEDVAYFMNQPIVKDYLRDIEKSGYSWLFIDTIVDSIKASAKYKVGEEAMNKVSEIPNKSRLWEMIGQKELTVDQKAEQQFILDEFLKYAMMANHMFLVTQGSNFDTSTFNDPFLIFKKMIQLEKARNTIISAVEKDKIVSAVDGIIDSSFLKTMYGRLLNIRNAFSEILISDKKNVRDVIHNVLRDYTDLPDKDFVKLAQLAVNNLFDWAVQNDRQLNTQITRILLSKDNVAKRMSDFISSVKANSEHPLHKNQVINLIVPHFSAKPNSVQNLKLKNKDNKVYDQNQIIYAMHELKTHLKGVDDKLYGDLIRLSILQSGLTNSPISFTSLLPYEDFKDVYAATLSIINEYPNLKNFHNLNVFQRKNWNNDDITPYRRAKWKRRFDGLGSIYNSNMNFTKNQKAKDAIEGNKVPQLLKLSVMAKEASSDVIVYSWEKQLDLLTEAEKKDKTYEEMTKLVKEKKVEMKKKGDFSYINKGLFKKVYLDDTVVQPFKIGEGKYANFVYKMINAWGDSRSIENSYFSANEFYNEAKKSVIDNGFVPVDNEVSDDTVRILFDVSKKTEAPKAPTALIADKATTNTAKQVEAIVSAVGYIKETAKKHLAKELFKIRQATQFIGTGGGNDSTTQRMENAYAQIGLANTGNYTSSDLVYVSSNGARANRYSPLGGIPSGELWQDIYLQGPYRNIDKVIAAGGRIIMDTAEHLANTRLYNIGEADLAVYLANKGYTRDDATGIWSKSITSKAPVSGVEITKTNYTREDVRKNPNTAYVFTENTHSITAFPNTQGGGSAIIRPEPNAFAIVTKKKYDYNTRENVDYSDTSEDFAEFTEVNTRLINELKNSGKSKIIFPQGFATDKAKMPTRFAEWLQKALLDNFGLVTELNSTKTGLISKSVSSVLANFSSEKQEKLTQLEKKLEEKGLGPDEMGELNKLRIEKGKQIKKDC